MNEQISVAATTPVRKRRPHATPQEKADWAKRFAESGLRQREFCRQHDLVLTTLQRWLACAQGNEQADSEPKTHFTEVKLGAPMGQPHWAAELCRPSGAILRLAHDVPPSLLDHVLRAC